MALYTPILFIVFNRPDTTKRVFDVIRQLAPQRLYIAADGPREGNAKDSSNVTEVRRIIEKVDWDCQVKTLFRERNLRCKIAVSSAIDWFIENVEEGIVLEDDCLPDPSFFLFCEELLAKYRNDKRIVLIAGDNFQWKQPSSSDSYYFSRYSHIWGWASWRRAWKCYDVKMSAWPEVRHAGILQEKLGRDEYGFWEKQFDKAFNGKINTWDIQLLFAFLMQNGLCVLPSVNLVSNIGFRADGTHTKSVNESAILLSNPLTFPLSHPRSIIRDERQDRFTFQHHYQVPLWQGLMRKIGVLITCLSGKSRR